MTYDCEVTLISMKYEKNDIGDSVEVKTERKVLAGKIDYRNKDFYQALRTGLKPSITFGINKYEYQDEKLLEYDGSQYNIIDVYPVVEKYSNEFEGLALLCEAVV